MEKIALLLNNSINLLSRKFDSLALELRNKKAPIINSTISIDENVSKGISQAVERSLDKLVIPSPKITFPEYPKFPKIPAPIINIPETVVNVPPAQITVEPAKVEFPKEIKIEGMDKLLESVNRETFNGNVFDEVSSKRPLSVQVVDNKGKPITNFGGDMTAPSVVGLKNGLAQVSSSNPLPVADAFQIPKYDQIVLTYSGDDIATVVYKLAGATIATLTLSYTSGNLTNVVKS